MILLLQLVKNIAFVASMFCLATLDAWLVTNRGTRSLCMVSGHLIYAHKAGAGLQEPAFCDL